MVRSLLCWLQLPLCAGAIFLVSAQAHAQNGWTQKKGDYYLKLYSSFGRSDKYFNLAGDKIMTSEFTQIISGFYGEYGPDRPSDGDFTWTGAQASILRNY